MKRFYIYFAAILGLATFSGNAYAADTIVDKATGVDFPSQVTFEFGDANYTLEATGVATRKKFFIKVYSIAHYLQDPVKGNAADVLLEVFNDSKAKQFTLHWVRGVDASRIHGGFAESFEKTMTDAEKTSLKAETEKFLGFFTHDVKAGDLSVIRWIPGGTIEVLYNDTVVGNIVSQAFAKSVWDIWFGPHSVVEKDRLIENIIE